MSETPPQGLKRIYKAFYGGKELDQVIVGGAPLFYKDPYGYDSGTFTDARDSKQYPWKRMPDGNIWMLRNMDYAVFGVYYNGASSPPMPNLGRMYSLSEAAAAAPSEWRLATLTDWENLIKAVTGYLPTQGATTEKLRSKDWPNGTDNYGFCVLPGGQYNGSYEGLNSYTSFWTSTSGSNGTYRYFNINNSGCSAGSALTGGAPKFYARCVKK